MSIPTTKKNGAKSTASEPEITPHVVIEEVPLEKQIDRTLVKHNVTNAVISKLKKDFGGLKLNDVNDKENYLIICDAKKAVRKVGIITEKICKEGRSDAIKIQKMWLDKEKEILGRIAEVQDPLDAEIKKYEDELERLEKLEEQRKDDQYNIRQTELIKMGAVIANGCLNINDLAIEISNIREVDEEDYKETILPLFQRQYEKNEAARIAEETEKQRQADLLKKQQDELAEQQAAFKKQQEEFQQQQAEAARIENEKRQQEQLAEQKRKSELQQHRLALLLPVNPAGADIDMATLWSLEESAFQEILTAKKTEFVKKQEEETLRLQEEAARKERERIEEEQRQAQIKAQQEEQQRVEEAAKASDKDKWFNLIAVVTAVPMPEFKSSVYKNKANQLLAKINEIKAL